jgi:hypothetical protein
MEEYLDERDGLKDRSPLIHRRLQLYKEMLSMRQSNETVTVSELSEFAELILDQDREREELQFEVYKYLITLDVSIRQVLVCFPEMNLISKGIQPYRFKFSSALGRMDKLISLHREATSACSRPGAKPAEKQQALNAFTTEIEALKVTISELAMYVKTDMSERVFQKRQLIQSRTDDAGTTEVVATEKSGKEA